MLCMCVNFHRPEKKHKESFLISYFSVTKRRAQGGEATSERRRRDGVYQKSARRTPPSSFQTTGGVHELVARVMRGKYVRQMAKRKSAVSRSPQSHLYHASEHITRESRADSCTHCLHARIYRVGGRGFNMCADGTIKTNPISLCSHPNFCQKLNREVRRSLTWHSSKSESALERLEPVAVIKL